MDRKHILHIFFSSFILIGNILFAQNLREVGHYDTPGWTWNLFVLGQYAYVADTNGGLRIIDISDAEDPDEVGHFDSPNAYDVAVRDVSEFERYAYLLDPDDQTFYVLDVFSPDEPTRVGTCIPTNGISICQSGDYAYTDALQVIDISRVSRPSVVGTCYVAGSGDICVCGDFVYVAGDRHGLRVVDVSDPNNPNEVGGQDTDEANGVSIRGNYAYVADGRKGLIVFDISDQDNPDELGLCEIRGEAQRVAVYGSYSYVTAADEGLRVVDITDPENPIEVDHCNTPGQAYDVSVDGNYAYIADMDRGLRIIDISYYASVDNQSENLIPVELYLSVPYPNPFNSSTTITYGLPSPGFVSLELCNPMGQRLNTLFEGYRHAGFHSNILTAAHLSSGLYFISLEASGHQFTRKVMLIR